MKQLRSWWARRVARPTQQELDDQQVARLRRLGVRIGEGCRIYTSAFSTEPWLVQIGDRVGIASGVKFLTHDGAASRIRPQRPAAQKLGTIVVGDDVFIGENVLLLPGTRIGTGSILGPGAVVRGTIPENSLVFGNPAVIIGRASLYLERLMRDPNTLDCYGLEESERRALTLKHFFPEAEHDHPESLV